MSRQPKLHVGHPVQLNEDQRDEDQEDQQQDRAGPAEHTFRRAAINYFLPGGCIV